MGWGDEAASATLMPEWAWVWRAWRQLHSGRRWLAGFSWAAPQPIEFDAIRAWAERQGLIGADADDLHHLIEAMDAEYQDVEAAKRAAAK